MVFLWVEDCIFEGLIIYKISILLFVDSSWRRDCVLYEQLYDHQKYRLEDGSTYYRQWGQTL